MIVLTTSLSAVTLTPSINPAVTLTTEESTLNLGLNNQAPVELSIPAQNVVVVSSGASAAESFETVAKNLTAADATLGYTVGNLTSINYTSGIVKTLAYGPNGLATITLSGATPGGIELTKTLTYTLGKLSGYSYS